MKSFLTIILFSFTLTISAQKYSNTIKDIAITNFMTWLIKSDKKFNAIRHIDNVILQLQAKNFIYSDSTILDNYRSTENIFSKENGLIKYFNQNDSKYFVRQIMEQHPDKWQLKIKGIKLFDTIVLVKNKLDKILYSYCLPIFSFDKKYIIIIEGFYCGLVCGGGEYNLYERQTINTWIKIKSFNGWSE